MPIREGQIVRHFKGNLYLVLNNAQHTETGERMVIYRALYGECLVYARPYNMFIEKVPANKLNPTGQQFRFMEVEIASL